MGLATLDEMQSLLAAYERQHAEWCAIRDELTVLAEGSSDHVTAYQVTLQQRKRLLARGERLLTSDDLSVSVVG